MVQVTVSGLVPIGAAAVPVFARQPSHVSDSLELSSQLKVPPPLLSMVKVEVAEGLLPWVTAKLKLVSLRMKTGGEQIVRTT
jgi:hypothetical protein